MDKFATVFISFITIVLFGLVILAVTVPNPEIKFYRDSKIMCDIRDTWGHKNVVTTCYKVEEIK